MACVGAWLHIWCDTCKAVQPLVVDVMPVDANNDHESADLLCDVCRAIIATVHHPEENKA